MKTLSIVVPCYNEEENITTFYNEVTKVTKKIKNFNFEILFVNDGSKDKTLEIIKNLSNKPNIKYISFSRNFGKEAAIYAGLKKSSGDYVCIMDVDLQDPPSLLPEMLDHLENENYDCVATRSISRNGYSFIRKTCTRIFYNIINKVSNVEMIDGARDFRIMTKQMVNAILSLEEYNRYSKGIFSFVGFDTKWITFENPKRNAGTTKWSFWKLVFYAFEGIIAFSTKPLVVASLLGILFLFLSIVLIFCIIIGTLVFGNSTSGWPSLVCLIFFVSGIQLFCTGILGQYMAKNYLETKKRPIYIIKEEKNED